MQPLITEKTNNTPEVILDKENGIFKFSGRSLPENAASFFQPVIAWFEQYLQHPNISTTVVFELEYFNSASAKIIITILDFLEQLSDRGLNVEVEWRYITYDSDTLETGLDFASMVNIPFTYKEISVIF